jgi:hypothetical protein
MQPNQPSIQVRLIHVLTANLLQYFGSLAARLRLHFRDIVAAKLGIFVGAILTSLNPCSPANGVDDKKGGKGGTSYSPSSPAWSPTSPSESSCLICGMRHTGRWSAAPLRGQSRWCALLQLVAMAVLWDMMALSQATRVT